MHLTVKSLLKRVFVFTGMLIVGVLFILFNIYKTSLYNELIILDLIPKPENFTELYFDQNATLPDAATENQQIRFAFVIHNLETTDMQYIYAVSVIVHGKRHIVDRGNVVLQTNHYYVKNEHIHLLRSSSRQNITVELINKRQSIDFWIGN